MKSMNTFKCEFHEAEARFNGTELTVTTGRVRRVWHWTGKGFATTEVTELTTGHTWRGQASCDWQLPGSFETGDATLASMGAEVGTDDGFTCEHICVTALIEYPQDGYRYKLTIWVYPGGSGIRTHLALMYIKGGCAPESQRQGGGFAETRVDRVPLGDPVCTRRAFGYYNDTQNRNDTHLDILKEERVPHLLNGREWCDWASAYCAESAAAGIALVKESHKCVNQKGRCGGGFVCDVDTGIVNTGLGMRVNEVRAEDFTPAWASWCVVWPAGDLNREVAFKSFDRLRFPIDPKRDMYIQANTWGSTDSGSDARRAACEDSVLKELEVCANLGIDSLQIDDGWQVEPGARSWQPGENGWNPHPQSYPVGWKRIRERAEQLGVRLGLWAAAVPVGLDELKRTHTDGGFLQYKLDFAELRTRQQIDSLMAKVREFIQWTGHKVRVNWDVTEVSARYGYFFAREYGCIYLENRKPTFPKSVVYRPHTVLRDLWQVSKYVNLHRFQCSVQNVDRVDPEYSDAYLHPHDYCTAIALMGIPLFFLETKYYSDEAKKQIKPLLACYKKYRSEIYSGIVHPIGEKPDNASWTGFQCHLAKQNRGYLTIFRERCNEEPQAEIKLGWLQGADVELTDLVTGKEWTESVGTEGNVPFTMDHAPGFLFLSYQVKCQS